MYAADSVTITIIDKTLLSLVRVWEGCFYLSRDISYRKARIGGGDGNGRGNTGRTFEKSAYRLVESPAKKTFLSTLHTDLYP